MTIIAGLPRTQSVRFAAMAVSSRVLVTPSSGYALAQKPQDQLEPFWDGTSWRDEYYERLNALPRTGLTDAQLAEQRYSRIEQRAVDKHIRGARQVADLGCGTGRVTWNAVEEYPHKMFAGVDLSGCQLDVFRRRLSAAARARVMLTQSSVAEMRLAPDAFDLALLCNHTFGAILGEERDRSLASIVDALAIGGILLIAGFSNLDLAPSCYENWGMSLVALDRRTGLVELAHHFSLWEAADAVVSQLVPYGLVLQTQQDFTLGYVQTYRLIRKPRHGSSWSPATASGSPLY
jgi:ubiquinone/menaquinone biosynthesis C-methylase UbiE